MNMELIFRISEMALRIDLVLALKNQNCLKTLMRLRENNKIG